MKAVFSAILIFIFMGSSPGPAAFAQDQVTPNITYEYYDISPERGMALYNSLASASPIFHEGQSFAGLTNASLSYKYQPETVSIGICRPENIEVGCNCHITLPRLNGGDGNTLKAFNKFLDKLKAHELEHCRITTYYANLFHDQLTKADTEKCDKLNEAISAQYKKLLQDLNAEQLRYDHRTVHGKYEGADLKKILSEMEENQRPSAPAAAQTRGLKSLKEGDLKQSGIYRDENGVWRNF